MSTIRSRVIVIVPTIVLALLLAACGGGGPQIDNRVLQLSISYDSSGPTNAQITGGRGAAASGAAIECRVTTGDQPTVGRSTANEFGAFTMALDHEEFPERPPGVTDFEDFNDVIECRPEDGSWTNPLRPPQVRIG